jgi:pimeloyl-ACP methyl ester carboxylesterase
MPPFHGRMFSSPGIRRRIEAITARSTVWRVWFTASSTGTTFSLVAKFIVVVNSFGGLVLERLLLDHPEVADKIRFAVYYGTPHQGSFVANFAKIFNDDPLLREMVSGDGETYLVSLDKEWRKAGLAIPRYCAY